MSRERIEKDKKDKKDKKDQTRRGSVEGEGSYSAARRHRKSVEQHVETKDTSKLGREAKRALEGEEGPELREAEERGKRPARH